MSGFEKFKVEFSSKGKFYSLLMGKQLMIKRLSMFLKFAIYLKYLRRGILLIADVLEKFRKSSLKNYGLCPSQYLNPPALNCDAMLHKTKFT